MFTEVLFTTAPKWKYPECLLTDELNKQNAAHSHNEILFNHKKL